MRKWVEISGYNGIKFTDMEKYKVFTKQPKDQQWI
jgi:hypothetical protein